MVEAVAVMEIKRFRFKIHEFTSNCSNNCQLCLPHTYQHRPAQTWDAGATSAGQSSCWDPFLSPPGRTSQRMGQVGNLDRVKLHYCLLLMTRFEKDQYRALIYSVLYLHQMERPACILLLSGACNLEWSPLGRHAAAGCWCHTGCTLKKIESKRLLCLLIRGFQDFKPWISVHHWSEVGVKNGQQPLTWFVMTSNSMIHPGLAVDCWLTMLNTSPTSF